MSEEAKIENRTLLRAALGVSKLEERKKDKLAPKKALKDKLNKLKKEGGYRERAVKEMLEDGILIYDSKAGSSEISLNCQAVDDKGEKIACRQLSYAVALLRMKEDYSEKLSNIEKIQQQDSLKKNKYDNEKIQDNSAYYNLFRLESLGDTLQSIAQVLDKGEECSVLLSSENHLMTISVRCKNNGAYVIKFYDPNKTNKHRRALCVDLDAISNLHIQDFLTDELIDKYFPSFRSALIFSKVQRAPSDLPVFVVDDAVSLKDKIRCFIEKGWKGNEHNLKNVLQEVLESKLTPDEKIKILIAKTDFNYSGLCTALFEGHVENVKVYLKTILDSDKLSDSDKIKLLTACVGPEKIALALFNSKAAAAAAAYLGAIASSRLSPLVISQILQGPAKKEPEESKASFFQQKTASGESVLKAGKAEGEKMSHDSISQDSPSKPKRIKNSLIVSCSS